MFDEGEARIVVELEPGEYLLSVHPSGTLTWKNQGDRTLIDTA